ncbi:MULTISPECIES: hypothetical protein [unclassified Streptomyces]|uniref:hypothetical protein n=1 Tax=unclassified Streptomyces TaxID=2593676 RepID=UPI000978E8E4|nr:MULTISPECIES: hypothetical protein [unclassified Streptomyces]ONI48669.1 hypothetical protein STIB_72230 [Streptomyces sp. IB2014 011-1]RDV48199.1 hypothetical protein DDV98_28955 [Streptomyces sp. IB2014 011-12]
MADTFGDHPRRPARTDGVGRSQRELQDRASFDNTPRAARGCAIALPISAAMWWGLYEAAQACGVIA